MACSTAGHDGDSGHDDGAAPRRSRRAMLAGGAGGVLGAIGFETLANTSQARAADRSSSNASPNTTTVVTKVAAGDGSITVGGTIARPKIKTGSLDEIAKLHPPAAAVNFNDQNGINVANGAAATDVAAFGQLPSVSSPLPLTEGGTGQSESSAGGLLGALGALQAANNLSDLPSAETARTNLGLGSAATADASAFDAAGAAATAQANAEAAGLPVKGGALTGGFAPAVVALGPSGGSVTVNTSQGNVFTLSLTASGWTIANPVNPVGDGQVIRIRLSQDATGGRTVSWAPRTTGAPRRE